MRDIEHVKQMNRVAAMLGVDGLTAEIAIAMAQHRPVHIRDNGSLSVWLAETDGEQQASATFELLDDVFFEIGCELALAQEQQQEAVNS